MVFGKLSQSVYDFLLNLKKYSELKYISTYGAVLYNVFSKKEISKTAFGSS